MKLNIGSASVIPEGTLYNCLWKDKFNHLLNTFSSRTQKINESQHLHVCCSFTIVKILLVQLVKRIRSVFLFNILDILVLNRTKWDPLVM